MHDAYDFWREFGFDKPINYPLSVEYCICFYRDNAIHLLSHWNLTIQQIIKWMNESMNGLNKGIIKKMSFSISTIVWQILNINDIVWGVAI